MKRSLNYTGRKRIGQKHFFAKVTDPEVPTVVLRTDLSGLELPEDALVVAEPHVSTIMQRLELGTVAEQGETCSFDLSALGDPSGIVFRIKVVDAEGRILAAGDKIRLQGAGEDSSRRTLLNVVTTDLGQQVWQLSPLEDGTEPVLQLNRNIPGIVVQLEESPLLQGAIVVPALRRTLEYLMVSYDETSDWHAYWNAWFTMNGDGRTIPDVREELGLDPEPFQISEEVEKACTAFAFSLNYASRAASSVGAVEG